MSLLLSKVEGRTALSANPPPPLSKTLQQTPEFFGRTMPSIILFTALIVLWHLATTVGGVREYLLPSPGSVLNAMIYGDVPWWQHIRITAIEIFGAFFLAGIGGALMGTAIAWSKTISRALMPLLVFINTFPKVAIAPLLMLWLGFGVLPNIVMGALIGFFPVVINTAVGLNQVDDDLLDLGRVFGAPKWRIFAKIRIPNAYPYIFSALKVTATSAVIGVIIGEFVSAQSGLGFVIIATQSTLNTPVAFAALIWIAILGMSLFALVALLARILVPWAQVENK